MTYAASELRKYLPNVNFEMEEYIRGDLTDNSKFVASLRVQLCVQLREQLCLKFRVQLYSASDVRAWRRQLSILPKTQWIHRSSVAATESIGYAVSQDFVCHHSAYRKLGWALRCTFRLQYASLMPFAGYYC